MTEEQEGIVAASSSSREVPSHMARALETAMVESGMSDAGMTPEAFQKFVASLATQMGHQQPTGALVPTFPQPEGLLTRAMLLIQPPLEIPGPLWIRRFEPMRAKYETIDPQVLLNEKMQPGWEPSAKTGSRHVCFNSTKLDATFEEQIIEWCHALAI